MAKRVEMGELPHVWTLEGATEIALDAEAADRRRAGAVEVLALHPERNETYAAIDELLADSVSDPVRERLGFGLMVMGTAEAGERLERFGELQEDSKLHSAANALKDRIKRFDLVPAAEMDPVPVTKMREKAITRARKNEKRLLKLLQREVEGCELEAPLTGTPDLTSGGYGMLLDIRPSNPDAASFSACVGGGSLWCQIGPNSCAKSSNWNTAYGRGIELHGAQFFLEQVRQGKYEERRRPGPGGPEGSAAVGRLKVIKSLPDDFKSGPDVPDFDHVPPDWERLEFEPY